MHYVPLANLNLSAASCSFSAHAHPISHICTSNEMTSRAVSAALHARAILCGRCVCARYTCALAMECLMNFANLPTNQPFFKLI